MEDFLGFLLIAGIILVEILKGVSKNDKLKEAQNRRPVPPTPFPVRVGPDAIPIPEFQGRGSGTLDELLRPVPMGQPAPRPTPKRKKKEEASVAVSIANSSVQDKRNAKQDSHYDHLESVGEEDSPIHSVEEAHRVIIQGEIPQRKH